MRQLLMLGFYCEVYRREPRCRVYVNDVLLDEFDIPHTTKKYVDTNNITLNSNPLVLSPKPYDHIRFEQNTPFLKYIEFDDHDAKEADLRIEIQNNDNNYSNGFMTTYTRVRLNQIFLLSKKLLNRIDDLKNNWKFYLKNYHIHTKKEIDVYYSNKKNQIFENFALEMILNFPGIVQQQISLEKKCVNWRDLPPIWQYNPGDHWIGNSGYFHLVLKKKLGFWRHIKDHRKGRWKVGQINVLVRKLYDKYKQYEDTRSTDT